jgi:hypothetical protein
MLLRPIQGCNSGGGINSSSIRTAEMKKGTLHVFRALDENRFFLTRRWKKSIHDLELSGAGHGDYDI